jgi:hypothetical protein
MHVDDIVVYARRCVSRFGLPFADLNDDCLVNEVDLSIMAADWLDFDYSIDAVMVDPCDPNLVAHWKLDGDGEDYSANKHHATVVGFPTWDPNGRIDGALHIEETGNDDYLDAGGGKEAGDPLTWADITGEITVAAWVRPLFTQWWQQLNSVINKGREEGWELHKTVTNATNPDSAAYVPPEYRQTISFYVNVPGSQWRGTYAKTDLFDERWHHVTGVYKIFEPGVSSEVRVYTDGVKEGVYPLWGAPIATCDWPVGIGINIETMTRTQYRIPWFGHTDDLRVYDRALDDDEIVGLVQEGTVGPVAHWSFDDMTANDISGNNHHGVLVNGATIVYDADRDSNVLDVGDANGYVDCGGSGGEPNCTVNPGNCTWADILGEFSVMAWVKPDMSEQGHYCGTVVGKGDWDGGPHWSGAPPDRNREGWSLIRRGWNNEVTIAVTGSMPDWRFTPDTGLDLNLFDVNMWDGKWHHIAAVWSNISDMDVFVDGRLAATEWVRPWNSTSTIGTNSYDIFIGANSGEIQGGGAYGNAASGFKGLIDDVRIYDRTLTQIEIASAMAGADLYVPLDSLAELYNLEGMNSSIINFRDYQLLSAEWLADTMFPFVP